MGIPVLVLGASGSGKSTSLRNFEKEEIGIFNVAGKPLPFRKKFNVCNNATYAHIYKALENPKLRTYAVDDSQYLMAFESFDHAKETGYGKFTNMAVNFKNMLDHVRQAPDDVIVYFLHHTETDENGRIKAKTLGKMLDNQLTLEGMFAIVLLCQVEGREHYFITNSDGTNPAKTPMDMFADIKVDNDLKMVDTVIREYWDLNKQEGGVNNE